MPLGWTYFHFLIEALVLKISQEITQESIAAVNFLVRENRRITPREIADSLSVSKGTVDTILHEHLQYSKVCAQWVQKHLTEDQKCLRMGVCFQHLLRYRTEGKNFLSRIVACDETWCHFFDWATKQMSMEWRHSGSPRPQKNSFFNSSRESDAHVFFWRECPLNVGMVGNGRYM